MENKKNINIRFYKCLLTLTATLFCFKAFSFDESQIEKYNWGGIEVVYLKDNRFPTYNMVVYFADGALRDLDTGVLGETVAAFDLLASGTRRYNQKDISDNLEFFGASYGASVIHEQTKYAISGLVKDVVPTVKKICHLFKDASYPKNEIKKVKQIRINGLRNMVNNHPQLAHRAFREITLSGTPFANPTDGKLKDIKKINSKGLKKTLEYFNNNVKKRIYLSGPSDVLKLKGVILNDCQWKGNTNDFIRNVSYKNKQFESTKIHFIKVPKANQARVIIGRFLNKDEMGNLPTETLGNEYLGGGFTSRLNEEIRVNRNLTYGIYSIASFQKDYGRALIASFTKNESVNEIIEAIQMVLSKVGSGKSSKEAFARSKTSLAGSHPFRFESTGSFLSQLIDQDHFEKPYKDIYDFQSKVREVSFENATKVVQRVFDWDKLSVLVLGDAKLLKSLKKIKPVKVHSYKDFL